MTISFPMIDSGMWLAGEKNQAFFKKGLTWPRNS